MDSAVSPASNNVSAPVYKNRGRQGRGNRRGEMPRQLGLNVKVLNLKYVRTR